MNKIVVIFSVCLCVCAQSLADYEVVDAPLESSLWESVPRTNQIYFNWKMYSWSAWLNKKNSGPLMIPGHRVERKDLKVFEARTSGVIQKSTATLTRLYLHNISTVRRLDRSHSHELLKSEPFTITTTINFPDVWANIINAGKKAKLIGDDNETYMQMKSVFGYISKEDIYARPAIFSSIQLLSSPKLGVPDVVNIQGITNINQIADFGSVVTLFYDLGGEKTLVQSFFVLAIKQKVLNMGIDAGGVPLNGESILLGNNPIINTSKGIGAGLPQFTVQLFSEMLEGL